MAAFLVLVAIATVVGLVVWAAVAAYQKNKRRVAALYNLTLAKGWQFSGTDPYNLPARWDDAPFGKGYARRAQNVITGEVAGHHMIGFDYTYKEDSRDSNGNSTTTTYHYAVCALAMPCALPELQVAPEGVFSRLGIMLGMEDIELESEDFNRRFRVRCPDPKLAMDVLSPRTMELLLGVGKIHFRFAGHEIVDYETGSLTAADLLNRTAVLAKVLAGVPAFVWKDHGGRPFTPSPGSHA